MDDWTMDRWKYFHITHRDHVVCNPLSIGKLDELLNLCQLPEVPRVVDIACGKAEMLLRLAQRGPIRGIGVDASPYFVADAERARDNRAPGADLEFVCRDGAEWAAANTTLFDLASCVGAEWVWGGLAPTCRALHDLTAPGGFVIVGTPYWLSPPPAAYLEAEGLEAGDFAPHLVTNLEICESAGLDHLYSVVSSKDDWDRYEGLQWAAAERFAHSYPNDPDLSEIRRRVRHARDTYLRWGRDTCNWALHLFRRKGDAENPRTQEPGASNA